MLALRALLAVLAVLALIQVFLWNHSIHAKGKWPACVRNRVGVLLRVFFLRHDVGSYMEPWSARGLFLRTRCRVVTTRQGVPLEALECQNGAKMEKSRFWQFWHFLCPKLGLCWAPREPVLGPKTVAAGPKKPKKTKGFGTKSRPPSSNRDLGASVVSLCRPRGPKRPQELAKRPSSKPKRLHGAPHGQFSENPRFSLLGGRILGHFGRPRGGGPGVRKPPREAILIEKT